MSDFFGALVELGGSILQNQWNRGAQEQQGYINEFAAQKQMDFQERMSNTAHQREVADLQAAGLNPMLSTRHGGASSPQGAMGQAGLPHSDKPNLPAALQTAAQIAFTRAAADKETAQAENIRADTEKKMPAQVDSLRQNIQESIQRAKTLHAQATQHYASAENLEQQTVNLIETIPQIRATVNQLTALTALNRAQAELALTNIGLSKAETKKLLQEVAANLPEMERQLMALENTANQMKQPGLMANEAAQSSLAGHIGAYLRALLPLEGLIGAIPLGRTTRPATTPPPKGTRNQPSFPYRR